MRSEQIISGLVLMLASSLASGAARAPVAQEGVPWPDVAPWTDVPRDRPLRAAFLVVDGVYSAELTPPFVVLHHTISHVDPAMEVFAVSPHGEPVETNEGLVVEAAYSFETAPEIDVLVVPSAVGSMAADLEDESLVEWVRETGRGASFVMSLCDGAFMLAAAGLLDGRAATTFPRSQDRFAEMFPRVDLRHGVSFVHDGKFLTSVGGDPSYDVAMYLVGHLYGDSVPRRIGEGLLIDWPPARDAISVTVIEGAARGGR